MYFSLTAITYKIPPFHGAKLLYRPSMRVALINYIQASRFGSATTQQRVQHVALESMHAESYSFIPEIVVQAFCDPCYGQLLHP